MSVDGGNAIVFVLIDGLGDCSVSSLNHQTPLQYARTPSLDALAASGVCGLLDPVAPGVACGSDTAHLSILGYDPLQYYRGRGAYECLGCGLDMIEGDIAFKSIFSCCEDMSDGRCVIRRRCDEAFSEWGAQLCEALDGVIIPNFSDVTVAVKYATDHRCGVRLRSTGPRRLCDRISGTDPLRDNMRIPTSRPLDDSPEAVYTSAVVNAVMKTFIQILQQHPLIQARRAQDLPISNIVLLRGPAQLYYAPPFLQRHNMRACMIAPTAIINGLGRSLSITQLTVRGATGDFHTNLIAKADAMCDAMKSISGADGSWLYDFGFLHIKAVDEASHARSPTLKVEWIERVDDMMKHLITQLTALQETHARLFSIVVCGDHSTPVEYGDHSADPVPFMCALVDQQNEYHRHAPSELNEYIRVDNVSKFNEIDCARGVLGRFCGSEVMPFIKRWRTVMEQHRSLLISNKQQIK